MTDTITFPSSIDRAWSWRCTDCDRNGRVDPDGNHWTDIVLFVFERHWHRNHMIELWPTGERHHGMYAWRPMGDPLAAVNVKPSMANTTHREFVERSPIRQPVVDTPPPNQS